MSVNFRSLCVLTPCLLAFWAASALPAEESSPAIRGYAALRTHPYLPPDFDEETFGMLWTAWPEPERSAAEKADAATRRRLTFSYYGLMADPASDNAGSSKPLPLGYIVNAEGSWTMNCLACHGGKVAGKVIPGLPNSHIALQTLTDDVRQVKLRTKKKLGHLDLGSLTIPLGASNGTTNAVIFGVALGSYRNPDMSLNRDRKQPVLRHHDVDAPPFWNVRKKTLLYADGHSPKTPRPLMSFVLLPRVTPTTLAEWEPQFADILAWIESVETPQYPFEIDHALATQGERLFNDNCARCHGTYGPSGKYVQRNVDINEVATDPLRFQALPSEYRQWMKDSWISHFGADPVVVDPVGYVAPPLDGIWASAPYFHNGSVPTLWHVLHSENRPVVWKRTEDGYDQQRVGLEIETLDRVPTTVKYPAHLRRYFDTKLPGKSAAGHTFPNVLSEEQKQAVLEYLKTL